MNPIIEGDVSRLAERMDLSGLQGKHVLISGASGMLASYFVFLFDWLNQHWDYRIQMTLLLRNRAKAEKKFGEILTHPGVSVLQQDVCLPIVTEQTFDYIIHGASMADPTSIVNRPFEIMQANTVGTANICQLARTNGGEILFLSTREIYGALDTDCIREEMFGALDHMNSRSCYPESKKCAEAMLLANYSEYHVPFKVVRIGHSYGPGMAIDNDGRIMSDMMHNMVHHEDFLLKSTGMMKRAFCYISDAIAALLYVMLFGQCGQAYNVTNETEEIAVRDLAQLMADKVGTGVTFQIQDAAANQRGYFQVPRVQLDTSRLRALGWKPEVTLSDGIDRTYRYFTE